MMKNFELVLTEDPSFEISFEWKVTARREYNLGADQWYPKFNDSMLYDAQVERIATNSNVKASANLDANKLFKFVEVAYRSLRIPLIGVYFPAGADGTYYTAKFSTKGFGRVEIHWWSFYPQEWEPIAKWFKEITTFLDESIDNKDT
jgi:hypothetical protein